MNRRLLPALLAAIAVGTLLLGPLSGGRGDAQGPPSQPAEPVGRFQVVGVGDRIVVIDTATGRCWSRLPIKASYWDDLGTPAPGPRK
jgi:hypothetical protein